MSYRGCLPGGHVGLDASPPVPFDGLDLTAPSGDMVNLRHVSNVEVFSKALHPLLDAMQFMQLKARQLLAAHGIDSLEDGQWHPIQRVIGIFNDVLEQVGPSTVRAIGQYVPRHAHFPPEIV